MNPPHLKTAVVRAREDPAALHVDGAHSGDVAVEQLGQHEGPVWQEAEGQRDKSWMGQILELVTR